MKTLHLVFENGAHIANQLAKTPDRACYLVAAKTKKNWQDLTAVEYCSPDAKIEAARVKSIKAA
jgi:predicted transcriptional regulator